MRTIRACARAIYGLRPALKLCLETSLTTVLSNRASLSPNEPGLGPIEAIARASSLAAGGTPEARGTCATDLPIVYRAVEF